MTSPPPSLDRFGWYGNYLTQRTRIDHHLLGLLSVSNQFDLTDPLVEGFDHAEVAQGYAVEYDLADLWELADRAVRIIKLKLGEGGLDGHGTRLRAVTVPSGATPEEAATAPRLADKLRARDEPLGEGQAAARSCGPGRTRYPLDNA